MKKSFFFGLGLLVLLNSCIKEPEPEVIGVAKARYVNAVQGSTAQDFYSNGKLLSSVSLAYGSYSNYFDIASGSNIFAVADPGSTVGNGGFGPVAIKIGSNSTVYYYKDLMGANKAGYTADDMTAPATGKARVRFLHLNHFLNNSIGVNTSEAVVVFTGLGFGIASNYFEVNPGTKFVGTGTGVVTAPVIDFAFQAGKIYTIWIDGSVATELKGHVIQQN